MFKDQFECYEAIANDLSNAITCSWEKIEVTAKYTSETSMHSIVSYWLKDGSEHSTGAADLVPLYLDSLAHLISTEEKGLFKSCTFILQKSGKYDVQFQY